MKGHVVKLHSSNGNLENELMIDAVVFNSPVIHREQIIIQGLTLHFTCILYIHAVKISF